MTAFHSRLGAIMGAVVSLLPELAFAQEAPAPSSTPTPEPSARATEPPPPAAEVPVAPTPTAAAGVAPSEPPRPAPVADVPPAPEDAPSLWPLKVTTSTWTRFEGRANYDSLGVSRGRFQEGDAFFYRARLGLQTNPLDLGHGLKGLIQFSPQSSGKYGLTGTQTEATLGLFEGYVRLDSSVMTLDFGRFSMNYGDALVVGSLDWAQQARAFDGVRGRYKLGEKAYIDAFGTLTAPDGVSLAEGHPVVNDPFTAGDSYFWGVYAGLGSLIVDKDFDLDVYVLGNSNVDVAGLPNPLDPTTTLNRGGATQVTFGGRVKQKLGALSYRLEADLQTGTRAITAVALAAGGNQNVLAYQLDGEIGYQVVSPLQLTLYGALGSGDDPTTTTNEGWQDLYPTAHKWFGLMDVIGSRTNVADVALKVNYGITGTTKFLFDAHIFSRVQDGGLGQVGTNKLAGYEFDTQLMQRIGGATSPFYARGLYGLFVPNSGHYASNDLAHYVEIEGGLVF